ncbi:MAG: hypothetical protein WAV54_00930 [Acidimicrobiales bacterium]|jgi:hypothetical protein
MLTRFAITRRADDDGVDASVVERDYVLAHIVAQLHRAKPTDGGQLVFGLVASHKGSNFGHEKAHDAGYPKAFAPRVALTRLH